MRVTGAPPPTLMPDLDRLMPDCAARPGSTSARCRVRPISRSRPSAARYPPPPAQAACFVVPNISRLARISRCPLSRATSWSIDDHARKARGVHALTTPRPQEVRDCLHEEAGAGAWPAERSLPAAGFRLQRRQCSRRADRFRHADPARLLRARAAFGHDARSGGGPSAGNSEPAQPAGESRATRYLGHARAPGSTLSRPPSGRVRGPTNAARPRARRCISPQVMGWQRSSPRVQPFRAWPLSQSVDPDLAQQQFLIADQYYERSARHRSCTAPMPHLSWPPIR